MKFLLPVVAAVAIVNGQRIVETRQIAGPERIEPKVATALISGVTLNISVPAVSISTLFAGDFGYTIDVPPGTTVLDVVLNASGNIGLYVRYQQDVDLVN